MPAIGAKIPSTMVKINKIYTKSGDKGQTGLVGGQRISKDSPRVHAYGDIDELNSWLGIIRTAADNQKRTALSQKIAKIQNELFDLGSELATPAGQSYPGMITITNAEITLLENWIDEAVDQLPELKSFVLPGGTELNGLLHVARAVCRRAERSAFALAAAEAGAISESVLAYINRLSDLLFALARIEAYTDGATEFLWQPGKK